MSVISLRPRFHRIIGAIVISCLIFLACITNLPSSHPARSQLDELRKEIAVPWKKQKSSNAVAQGHSSPHSNVLDRPNTLGIDPKTAHYYDTNGLLHVNEHGPHPIYELIARAEKEWRAKTTRASQTLAETVAEYKKRYKRSPPPGFDNWWDYVSTHKVQLPDEYDQIHRDLEPLWGVDPAVLGAYQTMAEALPGTFTISVVGGLAELHDQSLNASDHGQSAKYMHRAQGQLEMLQAVEQWLPNLRATFNAHDTPRVLVNDRLRRAAVDANRNEQVLHLQGWKNTGPKGLAGACPPGSPLAVAHPPLVPDIAALWSESSKSFVHDHNAAMDICLHSPYIHLHGFLQAINATDLSPSAFTPLFSFTTTSAHSDIRTVSVDSWSEDLLNDPPWNRKAHSKLYWRGDTTGTFHASHGLWNTTHRVRLVGNAIERSGELRVMPSTGNRFEPVGSGERVERALLNEEWMDVKFSGEPIQCNKSVCEALKAQYPFGSAGTANDEKQFKFLLDIDGNGWSPHFKRLITTKSLALKSTVFLEWYAGRIQPWLHYVPVKLDYTDIYDILAFFKGDIDGMGRDHDEMADILARAGHKWSLTFWRQEDMIAYMFRLFLEYARVMSPERNELSFKL